MDALHTAARILRLLREKKAIRSALTWPKFSIESFLVVSSLARRDVNPKSVIDAGANVGQFAVACWKILSPTIIHCFEPDPATVKRLQQNVSTLPGVQVHAIALGAIPGAIDFNVNRDSQVSSALELSGERLKAFPSDTVSKKIRVTVETLDRLSGELRLEKPILLKLDVQGYERQVLEGSSAILNDIEFVLVEMSFDQLYVGAPTFTELTDWLKQAGFVFVGPLTFHECPQTTDVIEMDALYRRTG